MFCTLLNLAKFYTAPSAEQLLTTSFDISTSLGQIANGAVQDMQIRVQNSRVLLIFLIIICLFSFFFGEGSVMLIRYAVKRKKRYYLGIFPKRQTPPPTPPFWEPLIIMALLGPKMAEHGKLADVPKRSKRAQNDPK